VLHVKRTPKSLIVVSTRTALANGVKDFVQELLDEVFVELEDRKKQAIKMQKVERGRRARGADGAVHEIKQDKLLEQLPNILVAQAYFRRYVSQEWLQREMDSESLVRAATAIQAAWRGYAARHHVRKLVEESLWPMKGWFEYTATGVDSVQVEVKFLPNPSFDDWAYFQ